MSEPSFMLADTGELVYIIAVLIMIGVGWVGERFKAKMGETKEHDGVPPRPATRRYPTSLPRPAIPPLAEDAEFESRERSHVPPAAAPRVPQSHPPSHSSARPSAHPSAPAQARPWIRPAASVQPSAMPQQDRPGGPVRPGGRQRPQVMRGIEERKAVIRSESRPVYVDPPRRGAPWEVPVPKRAAPPAPPLPPVAPPPEKESWARLTKFGDETLVRVTDAKPGLGGPAQSAFVAAHVGGPDMITTESLMHLTVAELQRALVLKELLDPPLALRDQ